jgi:VanZ family protein
VYVNGVRVRKFPGFRLSGAGCSGRLVAGTSPFWDDAWSGQLLGLALYNRNLTAAEVLRHSRTWVKYGRPEPGGVDTALALYLFDERAGAVVHDYGPSRLDLSIPPRYTLLDPVLLQLPWQEFRPSWNYWQDVLINIAGFIPFGFAVCAYLCSASRAKPAAAAIVLGVGVSLAIECLQTRLPTRNSDMTDLITNTLGTLLGVWLWRRCGLAQRLYRQALDAVAARLFSWHRTTLESPVLEGTRRNPS